MPKPIVWVVVIAIAASAYTAGAKAGRPRYRQIRRTAKRFWNDPAVKKARVQTKKRAMKATRTAAKKIAR